MFLLSQAPVGGGALSTQRCTLNTAPNFTHPIPPLFSCRRPKFSLPRTTTTTTKPLTVVNAESGGGGGPTAATTSKPTAAPTAGEPISVVGEDTVPLEGVIQFENPGSSSLAEKINRWGRVALLAGGDVLALLVFSAIGRFSHGFPAFDTETLRTADPFIAGWLLSAYFLGGFGEDGRGTNGLSKAVITAAKSWSLGIPLGIAIRAATIGHIPPINFILVTMGSTSILLIGWRTLSLSIFTNDKSKKNDVYKRGSPFELFELLTSLVRRW
ncbi:hypothetical protein RJ639_018356 [Escallonia herrerae]|uniref:Transmembrane protein n=1 Tax=Escallonia herrerae TaxID=1293975 RepID=A0AA88VBI4_9ASTE|nr:hypothetical protein RJ639_018356 [Escallonia herrerae]